MAQFSNALLFKINIFWFMWLTVLVYCLQENNFEDTGKDSQGNAKTVGVICSKLKIKISVLAESQEVFWFCSMMWI